MNKPELMTFTKWHFENGMEVPATMKVWARKMAAEQTDPFIVELCDYGFAEGEAQAIRSIVIGFMLGLHSDGRTLGERHGWAVRYAQYILNGGTPHNDETTHRKQTDPPTLEEANDILARPAQKIKESTPE